MAFALDARLALPPAKLERLLAPAPLLPARAGPAAAWGDAKGAAAAGKAAAGPSPRAAAAGEQGAAGLSGRAAAAGEPGAGEGARPSSSGVAAGGVGRFTR